MNRTMNGYNIEQKDTESDNIDMVIDDESDSDWESDSTESKTQFNDKKMQNQDGDKCDNERKKMKESEDHHKEEKKNYICNIIRNFNIIYIMLISIFIGLNMKQLLLFICFIIIFTPSMYIYAFPANLILCWIWFIKRSFKFMNEYTGFMLCILMCWLFVMITIAYNYYDERYKMQYLVFADIIIYSYAFLQWYLGNNYYKVLYIKKFDGSILVKM